LRGSIVATLLNHGAFSQSDVAVTSGLLLVYAIGLTAHLLDELMPRAFFALQDTLTPLWTTLVVVLINVVVSIFAVTRWGVAGIPLGLTVAAIVEAVVLVYLLERRLKGLMSPTALRHIHRCLNAGLAAIGAGTLAVATFGLDITGPFVANLAHLIIGGIFVGAVYVGLAWLYGVDEHEQIIERFGRSLRRAPKAP
jgi:putative peptidoglycan lipid II flippase